MKLFGSLLAGNSSRDEKMRVLRDKMDSLLARASDIRDELKHAEIQPGRKPRTEIHHWLTIVEGRRTEVEKIESESQDMGFSSQLIGRIDRLTKEVQELIQQGRFPHGLVLQDHDSTRLPLVVAKQKPAGEMFELNFEKIVGWLKDPLHFIFGVNGMGGVGKTTLLMRIHDHLLEEPNIWGRGYWVPVSQNSSVSKLQDAIAEAVGVNLSKYEDEKKRAAVLGDRLSRMGKIVLILDDMWEAFSVENTGIPLGESSTKIILSTRNLEVCRRMGCGDFVIQVKPLARNEAQNLFVDRLLNYNELAAEVKETAQSVADECGCLPLAIIVIAGSMRGVLDMQEWQNALDELRDPNRRRHDMENGVDPILKFSYDRLNNDVLKHCFLSCMLYPEYSKIQRQELIDSWMMEGLLEDAGSRKEQLNKGHTILNKLESACLLESTTNFYKEKCVKMHDLIREMAVSITEGHPRFIAKAGSQLPEVPEGQHWKEDLLKVSLRDNWIMEIPSFMAPNCPKLSVLMLCRNPMREIFDGFFHHMRSLTILDLSHTYIKRLPDSVSNLENLRGLLLENCKQVAYVPSLVKLTKLRVLDLNDCFNIGEAPEGMELLVYLEKLNYCFRKSDLAYFSRLIESWRFCTLHCYTVWIAYQDIARDFLLHLPFHFEGNDRQMVIYGLEFGQEDPAPLLPHRIQHLGIFRCCMALGGCVKDAVPSLCGANELKALKIVSCKGLEYVFSAANEDLSVSPPRGTLESLILLNVPDLQGLIKAWYETEASSSASPYPQAAATFTHFKQLNVRLCPKLKVLFPFNLLQHQPLLPNLETLSVEDCNELEEIFGSGRSCSSTQKEDIHCYDIKGTNTPILALPNLTELTMAGVPKLRSIYAGQLLCTSLRILDIAVCSEMKELFPAKWLQQEQKQQQPLFPNLEEIEVRYCKNMEVLFGSVVDSANPPILNLPSLKRLKLRYVKKLRSLYDGPLIHPSPAVVLIIECPLWKGLTPDASPSNTTSDFIEWTPRSDDPEDVVMRRWDYIQSF